jgi:DNA-binding NarL/FixJ family response regulator
MSPSVYVLEPQALFIPEINRIVSCAGGHVMRSAQCVDAEEIASLRADYAILDLDYSELGVLDGLACFQALAQAVKAIVVTEEHEAERLASFRDAGATTVFSKAMTSDALQRSLRDIFHEQAHAAFPSAAQKRRVYAGARG